MAEKLASAACLPPRSSGSSSSSPQSTTMGAIHTKPYDKILPPTAASSSSPAPMRPPAVMSKVRLRQEEAIHAVTRSVPMVVIDTPREHILGTSTLQYPRAQLLPMVAIDATSGTLGVDTSGMFDEMPGSNYRGQLLTTVAMDATSGSLCVDTSGLFDEMPGTNCKCLSKAS